MHCILKKSRQTFDGSAQMTSKVLLLLLLLVLLLLLLLYLQLILLLYLFPSAIVAS